MNANAPTPPNSPVCPASLTRQDAMSHPMKTVFKRPSGKRDEIPAFLLQHCWEDSVGQVYMGLCKCCNTKVMTTWDFECAHIVLDNNNFICDVVPVCATCYESMDVY